MTPEEIWEERYRHERELTEDMECGHMRGCLTIEDREDAEWECGTCAEIRAAVADEREACAVAAEDWIDDLGEGQLAFNVASAIRERSTDA